MTVSIVPVSSKKMRKKFVAFPYELYKDEPTWVGLPRFAVMQQLDPRKNPYFAHSQVQLFLAEREGKVVGRISAQIDENLNELHGTSWAQFGFFDCVDDQEVADALTTAAADWARGRLTQGRPVDRIVGPFSFSTNDDCGMLVKGFERQPIVLTSWHPPYLQDRVTSAGLNRVMDLLMWDLDVYNRDAVRPIIWRLADQLEEEHKLVGRYFNKKDLEAEVGRFLEVYNSAWEKNWGFVPLSEEEVRHYAKDLKPVLKEQWGMVLEHKETGEVAGAALSLPDFNDVLAHQRNGKLLPFGWWRLFKNRNNIRRIRVFALGVKPEYQITGAASKLYQMHFDTASREDQKGGETGWTLESNVNINRAMDKMGARVARRYRLFELLLEPDAEPQSAPDTRWTGDWVTVGPEEPLAGVKRD